MTAPCHLEAVLHQLPSNGPHACGVPAQAVTVLLIKPGVCVRGLGWVRAHARHPRAGQEHCSSPGTVRVQMLQVGGDLVPFSRKHPVFTEKLTDKRQLLPLRETLVQKQCSEPVTARKCVTVGNDTT